jgi:hypothetical protein
MKGILLITTLAGLIIIVALAHSREVLKLRIRSLLLSQSQAELLENKVLLEQLRTGGLTNALELLEMKFDNDVVLLSSARKGSESNVSNEVAVTLKIAKDYREKYPRKREAVIETENQVTLQKMEKKANEALSSIR